LFSPSVSLSLTRTDGCGETKVKGQGREDGLELRKKKYGGDFNFSSSYLKEASYKIVATNNKGKIRGRHEQGRRAEKTKGIGRAKSL
jgi:hypothetical protein